MIFAVCTDSDIFSERNNEILDNEYCYGDPDADSYMKLKEKYGSWD